VITTWRIVKAEYTDDAFSGEGAFLYAGRWHSAGTRIVYTAESASLATLEILVHLRRKTQPPAYSFIQCSFDEALVRTVNVEQLPPDWFASISPPSLRAFGDEWARNRVSPVLKVPSAITRIEFNYLLNPEHPDFASISMGQPRPFRLDLRLLT
jgi:RES domain-containing protein